MKERTFREKVLFPFYAAAGIGIMVLGGISVFYKINIQALTVIGIGLILVAIAFNISPNKTLLEEIEELKKETKKFNKDKSGKI